MIHKICIQKEYFIFHKLFLYVYILKGKVNGCFKSGLENIFRNLLWEKKEVIDSLIVFYILHESGIITFLKWFIEKLT